MFHSNSKMKKALVSIVSLGLVFSLSTGVAQQASAKTTKIVAFKNCKEMNKVYKGGVALSSKSKNKGGKTKFKPFVSKALYLKNPSKDRDNDGIACER